MSKGKDYFSKSLEKGLKILSLFNGEVRVLTQSQVARLLNLNMTSTYRYINTLVEMGYLEKDGKTKEIRPSTGCLLFCTSLLQAGDHLKAVRNIVDRIHRQYNISIEVAFVADDSLQRIYNREAEETFTYSLPNATTNSFHNTALGKAYLSTLEQAELKKKIEHMQMLPRTENTIVDRGQLLQEIQACRNLKFATTEGEYLPGLLAIAAPLYDPISGEGIGAVSFDFSVMQHSMDEIIEKYSSLIQETGQLLSQLLFHHT